MTGVHIVDGVVFPVLRIFCDYPTEDFTIDCRPGGYMSEGILATAVPTSGHWNWPPRA